MRAAKKVYNDRDVQEGLIVRVIEWCQSSAPAWFDDTFVHSVYIQFYDGRELSSRQVDALLKIADKFDIN